jgi:hypothetical protein
VSKTIGAIRPGLPGQGSEGLWLFNDVPRELRFTGVDSVAQLIEAFAKESFNTAKKVQEKT